jgi:hypothetical protein
LEVGVRSDGFHLGARVPANLFRPDALLREFKPIARLLVTDSEPGKVTMQMFAASDSVPVTPKQVEGWTFRPGAAAATAPPTASTENAESSGRARTGVEAMRSERAAAQLVREDSRVPPPCWALNRLAGSSPVRLAIHRPE